MGQSADAKIAFGFDSGDERPPSLEGNDFFGEIEIVGHGYDYAGRFIALAKTIQRGDWNGPCSLKVPFPLIAEADIGKLKSFCEEMGLTYKQPGWYIMAHLS